MAPTTPLCRLLLAAASCLSVVSASATKCKGCVADTVMLNGSIYTLDEFSSKHNAMAVKNGFITFLGGDDGVQPLIGPDTQVFDLEGRMAMPGLVDAHMHVISGGADLLKCSMNYQPLGLKEVLDHIQGCLDSDTDKSDEDWLDVIALDYYTLSDATGGVTKRDLDKLKTKRPILVQSADRHTFWVNSMALRASSITAATKNPAGGVVERLPGGNEPSGILQDDASGLLAGPAPPTPEDNIKSGKAALKLLREQGVTAFQDAAAGPDTGKAFAAIKKEGGLSARGFFDYRIDAPNSTKEIDALVQDVLNVTSIWNDPTELGPDPSLKRHAVKLFVDGVILYPANTGALLEPYFVPKDNGTVWEPDSKAGPEPYWSREILSAVLAPLICNRIDAQMHVDGDLAVRVALDALEDVRTKYPYLNDYRVGLAHNELTDPSDWPRFAELKADPIMSFQWSQASSVWLPNGLKSMGPVRSNYLEAWGHIAAFGSRIVYGSDWPIDPLDEWLAIKAGVTRSGDPTNSNSPASQGAPYNGTGIPGLSLTREQAIRAITTESSRFVRADRYIGSLEVGKVADVIILQSNYFEVPDDEIARQKTLVTMVGGEVVYIAEDVDFGNDAVAKFPNNDTVSQTMTKRSVGGIQGRSLSEEGREPMRKLAVRNACDHRTGHRH
ncbi:Amidohydro-3 domain-containing protein [Fusarium sp. LHS14.1]|nr:Amidohydro-3 domain-containing protein [Fusarium sp. LHS14.1]